jgi:hypothetical protein
VYDPQRLNDAQCEFLNYGSLMFDDDKALGFKEDDRDKHRTLWNRHRTQIMASWSADPACAGRRPWAFWMFDHPGARVDKYIPEVVDLLRLNLIEAWELPELAKKLANDWYSKEIEAELRQYLLKEGGTLAEKAHPQQKPLAGAQ